jgi:hypothetical protein
MKIPEVIVDAGAFWGIILGFAIAIGLPIIAILLYIQQRNKGNTVPLGKLILRALLWTVLFAPVIFIALVLFLSTIIFN